MIRIESLKDYINLLPKDQFIGLRTRIYLISDSICEDYPKYKD